MLPPAVADARDWRSNRCSIGRSRRGFAADRVAGRARRVVSGLFLAYFHDPTLLEDHVLLRYKEMARVRYLRDVERPALADEIAAKYRPDRRFARLVTDYVSGMTDAYALREHGRLMEMAAIPIPGSEQLKRESD